MKSILKFGLKSLGLLPFLVASCMIPAIAQTKPSTPPPTPPAGKAAPNAPATQTTPSAQAGKTPGTTGAAATPAKPGDATPPAFVKPNRPLGAITALAFNTDGKKLAVGTYGQAVVFDTTTWQQIAQFKQVSDSVRAPHYPMPLPVIARSMEERDLLMSLPSVRSVLGLVEQADVTFVGVGSLGENSALFRDGFITAEENESLRRAGAVGLMRCKILAASFGRNCDR